MHYVHKVTEAASVSQSLGTGKKENCFIYPFNLDGWDVE